VFNEDSYFKAKVTEAKVKFKITDANVRVKDKAAVMSLLWQRVYRKWKESQCENKGKKASFAAAASFFGRLNNKAKRKW
jgi:hypothetical protein